MTELTPVNTKHETDSKPSTNTTTTPGQPIDDGGFCKIHPTRVAIDRCYDCDALICAACKQWRTNLTYHRMDKHYTPFVTCTACCNTAPKSVLDNERWRRFRTKSDESCTIQ